MKAGCNIFLSNSKLARATWGELSRSAIRTLRTLTEEYGLLVSPGDLQLLDGRWYVTHAGLLRIARSKNCCGIRTALVSRLSDPSANRWIFRATVYKSLRSRGFVGYGDADPSNVSPIVRGAEMRVAETRAVNRALRKAYGIGLCSVEELGWPSSAPSPAENLKGTHKSCAPNGSKNGHPRLRDQLCLLIRKYELDPTLVKRYAADFCGTESLRDAGRDLVETFISTLAEEAGKDRAALVCRLNSYYQVAEVRP
jgi:hypothetical protein